MTNDGLSNGDFAAHKKLILFRFNSIDARLDRIDARLDDIQREQVGLRVRVASFAGVFGLLGWLVPQAIAWIATHM